MNVRTLVPSPATTPVFTKEYLIDQGLLKAVTSYTYSDDDGLDIITHFILDGNPVGHMKSSLAPSKLYFNSPFFYDIEVSFGHRFKPSERLLVVSELRLYDSAIFSGCVDFILSYIFNFLFDAGFSCSYCVYSNLQLSMDKDWNDEIESKHQRILDNCNNLSCVTGTISIQN